MSQVNTFVVTLRRSLAGTNWRQKRVLASLGLRRIDQFVEKPNNACIRGAITKIAHLVRIDEKEDWLKKVQDLQEKRALRPPVTMSHIIPKVKE
mmetsp:Transcript_35958/g.49920  ORF Transcript_35958/g.49920 Transcript_35958/m.49920 type:complete len:94 (-) Transcript_35958:267-548(-)